MASVGQVVAGAMARGNGDVTATEARPHSVSTGHGSPKGRDLQSAQRSALPL